MRKTLQIILFHSLFLSFLLGQTEQDHSFQQMRERFESQLMVYPQEKLHLHTDRDFYVPGEKIRFKAYLVDAHSHMSLDSSRYVYAELISPADSVISRVMIRPENGMYCGYLFLSELISEGNYTLRAFTTIFIS